jgi:hypothetical protein
MVLCHCDTFLTFSAIFCQKSQFWVPPDMPPKLTHFYAYRQNVLDTLLLKLGMDFVISSDFFHPC